MTMRDVRLRCGPPRWPLAAANRALRLFRPPTSLRPLGTLPRRGTERLSHQAALVGERYGIDWLTYHPLTLWDYHRAARVDAPAVVATLRRAFPSARRWVDVGAGSGAFAAEAQRRGIWVQACEHSRAGRLYARAQGVRSLPFDLAAEPPAALQRADLALCFEVAEHLPPELGERLISFLVGLAPRVVFTAAQPEQGGLGHVNEQPLDHWRDRFRDHGVILDERATEAVRVGFGQNGVSAPYLRRNLSVLARP